MNSHFLFLAGVLGLGGPELILIFGIIMLFFGGQRLPDLAKGLGKSIREFKKASSGADDDVPAAPAPEPARITTPAAAASGGAAKSETGSGAATPPAAKLH
jgi:sec-independent protein translocase protein TatA